jgi:hypothetical protein
LDVEKRGLAVERGIVYKLMGKHMIP